LRPRSRVNIQLSRNPSISTQPDGTNDQVDQQIARSPSSSTKSDDSQHTSNLSRNQSVVKHTIQPVSRLPPRIAYAVPVYHDPDWPQKAARIKQAQSLVKKATNEDIIYPNITQLAELCKRVEKVQEVFWPVIDRIDEGLRQKHWCRVLKSLIILHYCIFHGRDWFVLWAREQFSSKQGILNRIFDVPGKTFLDLDKTMEMPQHRIFLFAQELERLVFDKDKEINPSTYEPLYVPDYMLDSQAWELTLQNMKRKEKYNFMRCS
jgi:hypothetical protein